MDTAPIIKDDRTMVPLRFVSKALGAEVDWDGEEYKVNITTLKEEGDDNENPDNDEDTKESEDISGEKAKVAVETLNVREAPGTDKSDFDQIHSGESYKILERHTIEEDVEYVEWLMVDLTGDGEVGEDSGDDEVVEGWISADYVDVIKPRKPHEKDETDKKEETEEKELSTTKPSQSMEDSLEKLDISEDFAGVMGELTIGGTNLNVRKGPGLEYTSTTQVNEGEKYSIITKSDTGNQPQYEEWIKFELDDGTRGWSAAEYIKETTYYNDLDKVDFIKWEENENNTEVRLGPIKRTNFDDFTMDNPQRLVLDLSEIALGDNIEERYQINGETIKNIRTGNDEENNTSRIVLDLNKKEHYTVRWEDSHLVLRVFDDSPLEGESIVVDPGHGGDDTGAESPGDLTEKEVVLDVSLMTRDMLEELGAEVYMVRETDTYVSLDDRVDFATENNGDVFVSVHANAHPSSSIKGTETFYSSERSPLDFHLASKLQDSLLNNLGTVNRGVKDRRFRVLRNATMPAALVEIAFLTNEEDEKLLRDDDFREKAAKGITQGLLEYHKTREIN